MSWAGEAYDAETRGPNRKFRITSRGDTHRRWKRIRCSGRMALMRGQTIRCALNPRRAPSADAGRPKRLAPAKTVSFKGFAHSRITAHFQVARAAYSTTKYDPIAAFLPAGFSSGYRRLRNTGFTRSTRSEITRRTEKEPVLLQSWLLHLRLRLRRYAQRHYDCHNDSRHLEYISTLKTHHASVLYSAILDAEHYSSFLDSNRVEGPSIRKVKRLQKTFSSWSSVMKGLLVIAT